MTSWRQVLRQREPLEAELHLLDRQVVDSGGLMVGKVDDLELTEYDDGRLAMTAILTGPGALGPRIGGPVGAIATATWSRLSGRPREQPGRIDRDLIADIGTVVRLTCPRTALDTQGFETWVRTRVIEALPRAGTPSDAHLGDGEGGGDRVDEGHSLLDRHGSAGGPRPIHQRRMSELVGMLATGGVGAAPAHVLDVVLRGDARDRLLVDGLVLGRRRPGTLFGYHRHPRQGPWIVRFVVLALHRHVRDVSWAEVAEIDWDKRGVALQEAR